MEINNKNMCSYELRKAGLLITEAANIGRDVSGYGQLDVNPNSGNVYLWLEDYPNTMYISLGSDTIYYSYSCPECGNEWDVEHDQEEYACEECGYGEEKVA